MPINYIVEPEPVAVLEASCIAEDANGLLEFLARTPDAMIDLDGCTDLHTALVQTLLASAARCRRLPHDKILAACLAASGLASSG